MNILAWILGMVMAATLAVQEPVAPVYPLKPHLAAEAVPHIASAWDRQWIAAARIRFADRQTAAGETPLAPILFAGLVLMIWIQGRRELKRESSGPRIAEHNRPGRDIRHTLAPRWGLR